MSQDPEDKERETEPAEAAGAAATERASDVASAAADHPEPDEASAGAAAAAATSASKPASEPARKRSGFGMKFVAAIAIVAAGAAVYFWWQDRLARDMLQTVSGQEAQLQAAVDAAIEQAAGRIDAVDQRLGELETGLDGNSSRITGLGDDIEALPAELRDLSRRIDALQGVRFDARDIWLREQAEYYLVLANTELALGRRVGTAIEALELADDVLRETGDPELGRVRATIAAELQALRGIEQPDLPRLTADLASLGRNVFDLPMRAQAPDNFVVGGEDDETETEPGLGRLWSTTQGAMRSIIRVERQEEPVGQLLTEAERRMVRRQLALELAMARTALLEGRQEDFRASLVAADELLNREFNREARSVVAARELLAGMMRIELAPELPPIGDSLSLLRAAPGAD